MATAVLLLSAAASLAGREPEEWDDLPDVEAISFSANAVGFAMAAGEYYLVDRSTDRVREVSKQEFEQAFTGAVGARVAEVREETGIGSTVLLRTSGAREFTTRDAECSEGADIEHALFLDGAVVKDQVRPCVSIGCAEIVGGNLWLGTRYDGEYGEYPADGIVVQSLEAGGLIRKLGTAEGLAGDLIRAIRLDPVGGMVWVATNEGINIVDREFAVRKSLFFRQDLDPKMGAPMLELTATKQKGNPMVAFVKSMRTSDVAKFYATLNTLPAPARERFQQRVTGNGFRRADPGSVDSAFVSQEANVLVPLYLADARSSDERVRDHALSRLCLFRDQRVVDFIVEQRKLPAEAEPSDRARLVDSCAHKLARFGLVSPQQRDEQVALMLKQEREALESIRAATMQGTQAENRLVVRLAGDLRREGSRQGIEMINAYFAGMDGSRNAAASPEDFARIVRDAQLYAWIETNMGYEDGIAPAMLDGLRKLWIAYVWRGGCRYFDMRRPNGSRKFDARYAEAILLAIDRRPPQAGPPTGMEDNCAEAFKSQLADPKVREAFFRDAYPPLTPRQKELADRLGKEPLGPLPLYQ